LHSYGCEIDKELLDKELNDAEGNLFDGRNDKRNPKDFALWKKSKEGEPRWDSPWG